MDEKIPLGRAMVLAINHVMAARRATGGGRVVDRQLALKSGIPLNTMRRRLASDNRLSFTEFEALAAALDVDIEQMWKLALSIRTDPVWLATAALPPQAAVDAVAAQKYIDDAPEAPSEHGEKHA